MMILPPSFSICESKYKVCKFKKVWVLCVSKGSWYYCYKGLRSRIVVYRLYSDLDTSQLRSLCQRIYLSHSIVQDPFLTITCRKYSLNDLKSSDSQTVSDLIVSTASENQVYHVSYVRLNCFSTSSWRLDLKRRGCLRMYCSDLKATLERYNPISPL